MQIQCPVRLYLNADKTKVLREGDVHSAFLFRAVGQYLTEDEVKQYHLEEIVGLPHEDKSMRPEENKAPDLEKLIVQETGAEKKAVTDTFHGLDETAPSETSSVRKELEAKTDEQLAEIQKAYEVEGTFEKRAELIAAIMAKAGYKEEEK